ncbi:MAG: T9SS type A sorting domain-containing protein [Chitinophagaceae bacterium]|nr:T9SS type A sorting domain-containing protein [Chitinophagaceae bacterium]
MIIQTPPLLQKGLKWRSFWQVSCGSFYISTDNGLYFIDQNTVNGPAGTVGCFLVRAVTGLQDLASNVFPSQTTLPVKLSSFSVTKQGNNALLNWVTASEINVSRFEIERSYDGINFTSVGARQANGNSTSDISYNYTDPITISSGIIYYRLKTLDIDGKTNLSNVVALRINGGLISNFSVYPNPFTSDLKIELNTEKDAKATLRISNASGQIVVNRNTQLQKGNNVIVLSAELSSLNRGMYILDIITEQGKMTQKIIKR